MTELCVDGDRLWARLVALEFQGQLAGRLPPLKERAARLLANMGA